MPITPPPPPISRISLLKGFLALFLPLTLVLMIVAAMHFYAFYTTERRAREASEALNVDLARRTVENDIRDVVSDLLFLAEHIETQGLLDDRDYENERLIIEEFRIFAKQKGRYDQIRYLDSRGMEVVRVNFNGGKPRAVIPSELQDKASRYYFQAAIKLDRGGFYLSPLDLNVEEGQIEYPLKPVMRFATPVFDQAGAKRGVILLNYYGERLISNFTRAAANVADHIELVNSEGYWLSSPNRDNEWGFMFGRNTRFGNAHPSAWPLITESVSGQFQTRNGLFTFTTIKPLEIALGAAKPASVIPHAESGSQVWKIIARVSPGELTATLPQFVSRHITLYLGMLGLLGLGTWFLALSQHRHRAAENQRDYEQRFRHTLENIDLAAMALNRAGEITFVNDHFLALSGWHRAELLHHSVRERLIPEEEREEFDSILEQMQQPEFFPSRYENRILTRDGLQRLIAWNNTLSYDSAGHVIGVTGIGEDITEKRRTELELRKLYRAVQQSPSIVLITNRKGEIEYINPTFSEVTGYTPEEVIGKNPRLLKSGETSAQEYQLLWDTVLSGSIWRGEFHNRRKSGELYWESAAISAIRNRDGEITHFIAVKEDITERKRLQQEVEQRNRELSRNQTLAAMGRMASMIAHDLRNPLSSVKMTLQILGKPQTASSEEADELRQISLEQIRYMEDILSDMLTYSRPAALAPEWITVDKVIDMAASLSQRRLEERQVDLQIHYNPGLPTLYGDATKLRQVFANLISNAIQATEDEDEPQVRIEAMLDLGPGGTSIRIEVRDNGRGIPAEEIEKLFEPFFTTRAKGTGLGLAIVKRILEQHQASIEITPHNPKGTCVVVTLPINPGSDSANEEPARESQTS